jgi:hypothetical protein
MSGTQKTIHDSKREELLQVGVPNPSMSATTKEELARHGGRTMRGVEMTQLIEELLLNMSHATDTLGVPLLKEEIREIWPSDNSF